MTINKKELKDMTKEELIQELRFIEQELAEAKRELELKIKDFDINYLSATHSTGLVDASLGQKIKEPSKCWIEDIEATIIVSHREVYDGTIISTSREMPNNIASSLPSEDFVTLEEISNKWGKEKSILVIAETALGGVIYRYGNHGDYWELVGRMIGWA